MKNLHAKSLVLALVLVFGSAVLPAQTDFATSNLGSNRVTWDVAGSYDRAVLTVSRPDGTVFRKEFKSTAIPSFDLVDKAGNLAADGAYTWQIVLSPRLDAAQKNALAAARRATDPSVEARILAAAGLDKPRIQSGTFSVAGGSTVPADLREPVATSTHAPRATGGDGLVGSSGTPDAVIPEDEIIQGSLCVGDDCTSSESFGSDTIRLKENILRIHFDDTSTAAGFPANDWRLIANDPSSGGSSKFSIEDSTGAKTPFTVTAGAATNSIFVDSTGRVGFRTATPALDLHVSTGNTPAIRLEQTTASSLPAQTWDVGGNDGSFFVRDVTGGSILPFRIRPGAPTSSIDISANGGVGIGTTSPSNSLHVKRSDGTAKVLVEEASGTTTGRELLKLQNNGDPYLIFKNSSTDTTFALGPIGGPSFVILDQADAQTEFSLSAAGNLTISGVLTQNSSRDYKQDFAGVDGRDVLTRVLAMPIATWVYKEDPKVRHMGPVAEDFFSAFQLGVNDKGIAISDSAGVALAAIQGLYHEIEQTNAEVTARNAELTARNAELESRLATLEKAVQALAAKPQ